MRRREFITLLGGAAATWPLAASAQEPGRVRRISILHSGFPLRTRVGLLIEALRALGYDDGKTAAIELLFGRRKEIAELALARHLPSMHSFSDEVKDGGLMSYGPELKESYQRAAVLADRILKGTLPADLPVEEPTRFELAINLKTAKALGLEIRASLLARADEVIE